MGTCIICGSPADGQICETHQEDVVFEFRGTKPDQLTRGRYYEGRVDGIADFGVFVDIGDHVTGLLHESELDRRLESLDWERGDSVYVQVTGVRDNGNIDLGWSIRQSEREFRGAMIDDPDADGPVSKDDADASDPPAETSANGSGRNVVQVQKRAETKDVRDGADRSEESERAEEPERAEIESLGERVGDRIRLEGMVVGVRQTGGPTVFEIRDETATVSCAAFKEAGVRAYPEIGVDDVVRLDGTVEMHQNELQVETESLDLLEGDDRESVERRLDDAVSAKARPDGVDVLADHPATASMSEDIRDAAEAIRRAVIEARPVIVRHDATADGYLAGAAIERAVLPLVREEHAQSDAEYHYFDRRPLRDPFYDLDAATNDTTSMLDNRERHDEKLPLFVLVNTGSTAESRDGIELLDIYGAKAVVVDTEYLDEETTALADALVNPHASDAERADELTTAALGGEVAVQVNPDVRDDLAHLPAASYWEGAPEAYRQLAADAGYDEADTDEVREAIALEAYYQSYEDKRELIADILWGADGNDLAAYVSEQFRRKLERELETVQPNLDRREVDGVSVTLLDTDAFTHRFDFPSSDLLLDELQRRESADADGTHLTLGVGDDELVVRSTGGIDIRAVADDIAERVPNAGVTPRGGRNGRVAFLVGERDAVVEAAVEAIAAQA